MRERYGQGPFSLFAYIFQWEVEIRDKFTEWHNSHFNETGKPSQNAPDLVEAIKFGYQAKNTKEQRELTVLIQWYGIGCDAQPMIAIGTSCGVTATRICQIRNTARRRLIIREKRDLRIRSKLHDFGFNF